MKIINKKIKITTKDEFDFVDLTNKVRAFVKESQIKNGIINIQSMHTTCSVVINENEPLLLQDLRRHLEALSPKTLKYQHDDFKIRTVNMCNNECANGHAHCKAVLMPTSVCLNIINKELQLGNWQRIFIVELDRARPRTVQLQIIGE